MMAFLSLRLALPKPEPSKRSSRMSEPGSSDSVRTTLDMTEQWFGRFDFGALTWTLGRPNVFCTRPLAAGKKATRLIFRIVGLCRIERSTHDVPLQTLMLVTNRAGT